jgi:hypothetical protein
MFRLRKSPFLAERDAIGHAEVPQSVTAGFPSVHPLVTTGAEFHLGDHGLRFLLQNFVGMAQVAWPMPDTESTPIMANNRGE